MMRNTAQADYATASRDFGGLRVAPPQGSRREFLQGSTAAFVATATAIAGPRCLLGADTKRVTVGAHPWGYAATQPNYNITRVLGQIFADMRYAGMDGIELMHTALRADGAVERIGELSVKHALPVLGTLFGFCRSSGNASSLAPPRSKSGQELGRSHG
jgi:hypothetical protein